MRLADNNFRLPGPYPAKVVRVSDRSVITKERVDYSVHGKRLSYTRRDPAVMAKMLDAGLKALTGCDDYREALRIFFEPADVIGLKVVPVGGPEALTSYELITALVTALETIGIRRKNILVFDRFKADFLSFAYDRFLPEGVRWECAAARFDRAQLALHGLSRPLAVEPNVSGYSRHHYIEFPVACREAGENDEARFRSHLCNVVARKVDKVISLPCLKDHLASGITFALKNLSHGLFNNVYRTHPVWQDKNGHWRRENSCNEFIRTAVSHETVRVKSTLVIGDAIICAYNGGPGAWSKQFAMTHCHSLFFASDPVAVDAAALDFLDGVRAQQNLLRLAQIRGCPGEAELGEDGELFESRQVEHIVRCQESGLGEIAEGARVHIDLGNQSHLW